MFFPSVVLWSWGYSINNKMLSTLNRIFLFLLFYFISIEFVFVFVWDCLNVRIYDTDLLQKRNLKRIPVKKNKENKFMNLQSTLIKAVKYSIEGFWRKKKYFSHHSFIHVLRRGDIVYWVASNMLLVSLKYCSFSLLILFYCEIFVYIENI